MTYKISKNNTAFCLIPWIHAHIQADASVVPCCVFPHHEVFGSLKDLTIDELINNERFNSFRKDLLNGKKSASCAACYEVEDGGGKSLRQIINEGYKHHLPYVSETNQDGSLNSFKLRLLEVKFSNVCNFKCRSCNADLSSSWHSDEKILFPNTPNTRKYKKLLDEAPKVWKQLKDHIPHLDTIFFAGGETLLMPEQYEFLDELIAAKNTKLSIIYNTNLSILKFKHYDIMKYWKHFSNIKVQVSIDDIEERGEYFRSGLKWNLLIKNFNKLKKEFPNIEYLVNCTVNAFNIHRIPEIHKYLLDHKLVDSTSFNLHTLSFPKDLRTQTLPNNLKNQIKIKLLSHLDYLKENFSDQNWSSFEESLNQHINFMYAEDNNQEYVNKLLDRTFSLDKIRNENFRKIYPELSKLKYKNPLRHKYLHFRHKVLPEKAHFLKNHWYGEMWRIIFIPIKALKKLKNNILSKP